MYWERETRSNSNLPETSIFLLRSNCYEMVVLSVQGNVTLCEVIFMSKTKPPSEDLDSDTVQTGVSFTRFMQAVDLYEVSLKYD